MEATPQLMPPFCFRRFSKRRQAMSINACDWKQRCFKRKNCVWKHAGAVTISWVMCPVETQAHQGGVQRNSSCTHMFAWPPASG